MTRPLSSAERTNPFPYATPPPPSRASGAAVETDADGDDVPIPCWFLDVSRRISKRLASKVDRPTAPQRPPDRAAKPSIRRHFHMRGPNRWPLFMAHSYPSLRSIEAIGLIGD